MAAVSGDKVSAVWLYEPARVLMCSYCKAAIRPNVDVAPHFRQAH